MNSRQCHRYFITFIPRVGLINKRKLTWSHMRIGEDWIDLKHFVDLGDWGIFSLSSEASSSSLLSESLPSFGPGRAAALCCLFDWQNNWRAVTPGIVPEGPAITRGTAPDPEDACCRWAADPVVAGISELD